MVVRGDVQEEPREAGRQQGAHLVPTHEEAPRRAEGEQRAEDAGHRGVARSTPPPRDPNDTPPGRADERDGGSSRGGRTERDVL